MTSGALDAHEQTIAYKYYDCLNDIAAGNGVPIARVHAYWEKEIAAGMDFSRLVQADRVHPTVEGYRLMAEAVAAVALARSAG